MLGLRTPQIQLVPPPLFSSSKSKPVFPQFLPVRNPNLRATHIKAHAKNGNKNNGDEGKAETGGGPRFNLRWMDLVLDPDPDNIVAVGLTGLLTWASVQVLWQLFVISAATLLAALKYTIVAALLVFILITLL